ncbi:MAG: universal stress protein [Acidimicrobiaceae bacterium]|nr:universal stress protein [Acidimicrobiaceae bacterium]
MASPATSSDAVRWAARRAVASGAELRLVTAVTPPLAFGPPGVPLVCVGSGDDVLLAGREIQREVLEQVASDTELPARIQPSGAAGRAVHGDADTASDADLLVLNRSARRAIRHPGPLPPAGQVPVIAVEDDRPALSRDVTAT